MIRFDSVRKVYGSDHDEVVAVDGVSLEIEDGETVCLIGTSGCGKTTTLKMVNRLVEPTSGRVAVDGIDVREEDVIALRRRIGYVIQKGGLFPHLTVGRNVGLLGELEGWSRAAVDERVSALLELVNLPPEEFAHRWPRELSGGQQQRVGVARALALDPRIVLMDEPFGALDPITRDQLHEEFLRLEDQVKKTVLLVTRDLAEAFKLGVELPPAARTIMAGIRTSAVISVGVATLAAFIGAGGLGDPIVTGLTLNDTHLILSGAIPAAVLAVVVDAVLGQLERFLIPSSS